MFKIGTIYDSLILVLGVYRRETLADVYQIVRPRSFIEAKFVMKKNCFRQLTCSTTEKLINYGTFIE